MRVVGLLRWIYFQRSEDPPEVYLSWEGPEDTRFIRIIRDVLVRRTSALLRRSVVVSSGGQADSKRGGHRAGHTNIHMSDVAPK